MKPVATESDLAFLAAIRGTFGEPTSSRDGKHMLSCFLFLLSAFLIYIMFPHGQPYFPIGFDRLFIIIVALGNVWVGAIIWRSTGQTYIFDGTVIRQLNGNGRAWKEIQVSDVTSINFRQMKGIRSMQLQTERMTMGVLLYPDLMGEICRLSPRLKGVTYLTLTAPRSQSDSAKAAKAGIAGMYRGVKIFALSALVLYAIGIALLLGAGGRFGHALCIMPLFFGTLCLLYTIVYYRLTRSLNKSSMQLAEVNEIMKLAAKGSITQEELNRRLADVSAKQKKT
jgi:hypothetical protein